jgi:hypothetical protein
MRRLLRAIGKSVIKDTQVGVEEVIDDDKDAFRWS